MPALTAPAAHTLVDLLRQQVDRHPDKVAFRFSYHGDGADERTLTYRELDLKARAIAANLQHRGAAGERVLVFCRPGLDSIAGFFGCVYAGAIAVPVHERLAPRLSAVIPDAQAGFALAAPEMPANIKTAVDTLIGWIDDPPLRWCGTDAAVTDAENWLPPDVDAGATAMIQYTSGSTRSPKGVLLTHRNLLHNLAAIQRMWGGDEHTVAVWWMPPHHDMGLIGGHLAMLYVGCTTVSMSPSAFIQRPMRWLEAISRHRATLTAGPNFAFDLCVERSTAEERAALDLSSLTTVWNGAEPVRAATLAAFADAFAPAGFRLEAFCPVYGLAEATVLVSGGSGAAVPGVRYVDRGALSEDRIVDIAAESPGAAPIVGCGQPQGGLDVVIVDPITHRPCEPDRVGEIWIAGPSVAPGYWERPEETEQNFSAFLSETAGAHGPFLRTGDLGFRCAGELFITGRVKDLVVIDGHHYYPNDIEATVQACHPGLLSGRGAVFTVPPKSGGAEQLVVVQEVALPRIGELDIRDIVDAIQAAIIEYHGIQADSVLFVQKMRIPTTSSGKIQRGACRAQVLDHSLDTLAEWHAPAPPTPARNLAEAELAETIKVAAARRQRASRRD